MVAVDVDGTLTGPDLRLSLEAVSALRRAEEAGLRVCLVTGNSLPVAYALARYVGASGPVVAENGGVVYHGGEVWTAAPREPALRAAEVLAREMGLRPAFQNRWRLVDAALKTGPDFDLEEARRLVRGLPVRLMHSGFALHVVHESVDKGVGLREAARRLGISLEEAAAVGDSETDIPMLRAVGLPAAVANAPDSLKRVALLVSEREDGEGVAEILDFILSLRGGRRP